MRPAIVIPALNEAATIASVVRGVAPYGQVVVVDDGSTDATGTLAAGAGAVVVSHAAPTGYDGALRAGFAEAAARGHDVLVSFDADAQFDPADLRRVLEPIARGEARLVLGVRPSMARWSEWLFGLYTRWRFGVPDILCGVKAVAADVYERHKAASAGASINTGLALAALRAGTRFALVPLAVKPRAGRPRFGGAWRANARIFAAFLRALRRDLAPGAG